MAYILKNGGSRLFFISTFKVCLYPTPEKVNRDNWLCPVYFDFAVASKQMNK